MVAAKLVYQLSVGRQLLPAFFVALAIFAAAETMRLAALAAVLVSALVPWHGSSAWVVASRLGAIAASLLWGPVALPVLCITTLAKTTGAIPSVVVASAIALAREWSPKVGLLADDFGASFATALAFVLPASFASYVICFSRFGVAKPAAFFGLVSFLLTYALVELSWLGVDTITAPIFRLSWCLGVVLILWTYSKPRPEWETLSVFRYSIALLLGIVVAYAFHMRAGSISQVVFDESHGDWASTSVSLEPDDFGRNTTYSWRALFNLLKANGLEVSRQTDSAGLSVRKENSLYVLKMPIDPIEQSFSHGLLEWVRDGGQLLVVADHTDLFDTTQNLNKLLDTVGVRIAPTAVFDRKGMPPIEYRSGWLSPSWLTGAMSHRFLTGASFSSLPWFAIPVSRYGMTFAESAVYFKPNRFGYFQPSDSHPYTNNLAVAMIPHGKGSVQIWLDSTHWSTFATFQLAYQQAFWDVIKRAEYSNTAKIYGLSILLVTLFTLAIFVPSNRKNILAIGIAFSLGLLLWISAAVQLKDVDIPTDNKTIHVVMGSSGTVELLPTLVESPERNYARAFTSLQKWSPVRLHESVDDPGFDAAESLVFIDLSSAELPRTSDVYRWIEEGKTVSVISNPTLLTYPAHRQWLQRLGFALRWERGLSVERDASSDLAGRRAPELVRQGILRFTPLPDSAWTENVSAQFGQSFSLRSSAHRSKQPTGLLVLGARSEQFSDAALGDVWDSVPVDDLARLRERQLANFVLNKGTDVSALSVKGLGSYRAVPAKPIIIPRRFLVVSGGQLLAEGILGAEKPALELSLSETPEAYAWRLRLEVMDFLQSCQTDASTGYCQSMLIDSKLTEWFVFPKRDPSGQLVGVELIHDGRHSGVRDGLNVVFD